MGLRVFLWAVFRNGTMNAEEIESNVILSAFFDEFEKRNGDHEVIRQAIDASLDALNSVEYFNSMESNCAKAGFNSGAKFSLLRNLKRVQKLVSFASNYFAGNYNELKQIVKDLETGRRALAHTICLIPLRYPHGRERIRRLSFDWMIG